MGKNKKIIILGTLILVIAVVINIMPPIFKVTPTISVYSVLEQDKQIEKVEKALRTSGKSFKFNKDGNENADIKLKFSFTITETEKKDYDILKLSDEQMYAICSKGEIRNIDIDKVKQAMHEEKQINESINIFSKSAQIWCEDYFKVPHNEAYSFNALEKLVIDDSTITGILFGSEIFDKESCSINPIKNNGNNNFNNGVALNLLIRKGTFSSQTEKKVLDALKTEISK